MVKFTHFGAMSATAVIGTGGGLRNAEKRLPMVPLFGAPLIRSKSAEQSHP